MNEKKKAGANEDGWRRDSPGSGRPAHFPQRGPACSPLYGRKEGCGSDIS